MATHLARMQAGHPSAAPQQPPISLPEETEAPMTHRQIMEALIGLLAALFTAILSSTIVSNALPTILSDLKGSQTDYAWIITASLLAMAATTPIWGKLSDLFNKKTLVQISIVIFVVGSMIAGFSHSIAFLLTARVIQGIGMGGLTALAASIIGTMIPPRERGKYSGYMGAVMAVATAGGPLVGGAIVDSPLGWRWTFFVCVPLAVIALIALQLTLKVKSVKREAHIDWLGAVLLTAGVSLILIWVSFAGKNYDWISWESLWMVGGGVVLLALLIFVESKARQPIIPLKIISERTTALSILASIAVGVAMFGASGFLGQYFQTSRGATPTEAGLLMLPFIFGNLLGSVASGILISRFGRWKAYLVVGSILLMSGLGLTSTIDHSTNMTLVGVFIAISGLGIGLVMQNLVLAVQNTVRKSDIGAASSSVAFFRTFGGAVGVSVLGTILANRVTDKTAQGFAKAGIKVPAGSSSSSTLDLNDMPAPIRDIVRGAYGDATGLLFLVAACVAVVAFICVLFIKEVELRRTVDMVAPPAKIGTDAAAMRGTEGQPAVTASSDFGSAESAPAASGHSGGTPSYGALAQPASLGGSAEQGRSEALGRSAIATVEHGDLDQEFEQVLQREPSEAGSLSVQELSLGQQLAHTQQLLAQQQLHLSRSFDAVLNQSVRQERLARDQSETAVRLKAMEDELARQREVQAAAIELLAQHAGQQRPAKR